MALKLLVLLLLCPPRPAAAGERALEARAKGAVVAGGTAAELSARVATSRVVIPNPFLDGRSKPYEAFPAAALLDALYGRDWREAPGGEVAFLAADGYAARVTTAQLLEGGAWLAFRDLERAPAWEPVGDKKADPGPFFLIWEGGRTPERGYAWPWQVVALETTRFEDAYPHLAPAGAKPASAEARGYALFRARCVKCHGLDQEGGSVGPDLNSPRSVTEYRPKDQLKAFIRKASSFRYTQMPDQDNLSDQDLEDLWRYLKLKSAQRQQPW
ncbi:MAG: cytochrome c [Elusimicrobia bacterium]|nr:cytochrome c [Elusimicrobiota bacterium]